MLIAYFHPGYAAPIGDHIMPIRKFGLVAEAIRDLPNVNIEEPAAVTEEDILRVHTPQYVRAIRTGEPRELAESQKFPWSPELYPSVCLTSGGCLAAAERALDTGVAAALVSGFHHSHADHGEGFCTFNGLVIAAEALRAAGKIERTSVLDMDLHFGNGTAALAMLRPWLQTISIYGQDYDENHPDRDVTKTHRTDGPTRFSFPLPNASGREELLDTLNDALPHIVNFKPDLLLYQAGADPYYEDPYSPLMLDHDDLLERDRAVFTFAKREKIPIAWVLAGGYTKDVSKVVKVHVNTFVAAGEVWGQSS